MKHAKRLARSVFHSIGHRPLGLISHLVAEYIFNDFAEAIELTPKLVRILGEGQEADVTGQKSSSQSLRFVSFNSDPQINTEGDRLNEL
jgi:hypothetical protein